MTRITPLDPNVLVTSSSGSVIIHTYDGERWFLKEIRERDRENGICFGLVVVKCLLYLMHFHAVCTRAISKKEQPLQTRMSNVQPGVKPPATSYQNGDPFLNELVRKVLQIWRTGDIIVSHLGKSRRFCACFHINYFTDLFNALKTNLAIEHDKLLSR